MNANRARAAEKTDTEAETATEEDVPTQVPAEAEADIAEGTVAAGTDTTAGEEGKEVLHTVPDQDLNSHFFLISFKKI